MPSHVPGRNIEIILGQSKLVFFGCNQFSHIEKQDKIKMLMQMQIDDGDYKEMMMRTGPRATVVESSIKEWRWRRLVTPSTPPGGACSRPAPT